MYISTRNIIYNTHRCRPSWVLPSFTTMQPLNVLRINNKLSTIIYLLSYLRDRPQQRSSDFGYTVQYRLCIFISPHVNNIIEHFTDFKRAWINEIDRTKRKHYTVLTWFFINLLRSKKNSHTEFCYWSSPLITNIPILLGVINGDLSIPPM